MAPKLVLKHDSKIRLEVLHEDRDVLAISKPFGVLAHPSPGFWHKGTLAHALVGRVSEEMMAERGDHNEWDSYIPRCIVHRLDAGTSGVMVIAKTRAVEQQLVTQLRAAEMDHSGKKIYVALLAGHPGQQGQACLTCEGAIGRDPSNPKRWAVVPDGKAAKTVFRVHAFSKQQGFCLVTAELFSGRTHQIRVHAAFLGAPVANDHLYGRSALGLPRGRQLLHAWALDIMQPMTSQELHLRAPLPTDLTKTLDQLWPDVGHEPSTWPGPGLSRLARLEQRWISWWDSTEGEAWRRARSRSRRQGLGVWVSKFQVRSKKSMEIWEGLPRIARSETRLKPHALLRI